ncbi:MAG: AMP-binding protein [Pyrinomonadaceae bacterium]
MKWSQTGCSQRNLTHWRRWHLKSSKSFWTGSRCHDRAGREIYGGTINDLRVRSRHRTKNSRRALPPISFGVRSSDALNYKKDGEWHSISSAEVVDGAEQIGLGLYELGLRKGDRAAILAPNSPEWTLSDAGCQFSGVIDVPIYTTLSPDSVRYIIDVGSD